MPGLTRLGPVPSGTIAARTLCSSAPPFTLPALLILSINNVEYIRCYYTTVEDRTLSTLGPLEQSRPSRRASPGLDLDAAPDTRYHRRGYQRAMRKVSTDYQKIAKDWQA